MLKPLAWVKKCYAITMKGSTASVFLAALVLGSCSEEGPREVGTKKSNESIDRASTLIVRDYAGDIEISGSKGATLEVEATITSESDSEKNDKKAMSKVDVKPKTSSSSATLNLRWELPRNYGSRVAISADKELRLEIDDRAGNITINDWEGKVVIKDGSGDIILNNVESYKIESKSSGSLIVDGKEEDYEED